VTIRLRSFDTLYFNEAKALLDELGA